MADLFLGSFVVFWVFPENSDELFQLLKGSISLCTSKYYSRGIQIIARAQRCDFSYGFLRSMQKHADANENERIFVSGGQMYYLEDLFEILCKLIFEKVAGSGQSYTFWGNFPQRWTVTENNIKDQKNLASKVFLKKFVSWAIQRISNEREYDPQLNDVLNNLSPEINPSRWAAILILLFAPYSDDHRVKAAIERKWSFGYTLRPPRVFLLQGTTEEEALKAELERQRKEEVDETQNAYELALLIFSREFTDELLKKCLTETNELRYDEETNQREYHRRLEFVKMFEGLMAIRARAKN